MVPGLMWVDLIDVVTGIEQVMSLRALYRKMQVEIYHESSNEKMGIVGLYASSTVDLANHDGTA